MYYIKDVKELSENEISSIVEGYLEKFHKAELKLKKEEIKVDFLELNGYDLRISHLMCYQTKRMIKIFEERAKSVIFNCFPNNYRSIFFVNRVIINLSFDAFPIDASKIEARHVYKLFCARGKVLSDVEELTFFHKALFFCKECFNIREYTVDIFEDMDVPKDCRYGCKKNTMQVLEHLKYITCFKFTVQDLTNFKYTYSMYWESEEALTITSGNAYVFSGFLLPDKKFRVLDAKKYETEKVDLKIEGPKNLSKKFRTMKNVYARASHVVCPMIYGHENVKKALLCSFVSQNSHILMIGDPSTAKSQFLKFIERSFENSVYVSGSGASGPGLTASVVDNGKEFKLNPGALVQANNGFLCLDEFDKIKEKDVSYIYESMSGGSFSISKAGIHKKYDTNACIIAACNPKKGSIDPQKPISHQINFSPKILNRFNFVFLTEKIKTYDETIKLAEHILNFQENCEDFDIGEFVAETKNFEPTLSINGAINLLGEYRKAKEAFSGKNSRFRINVGFLKTLINTSKSIAKCMFSNTVSSEHADEASRLINESILYTFFVRDIKYDVPFNLVDEVGVIESFILRKYNIGNKVRYEKVYKECLAFNWEEKSVKICLEKLIKEGVFECQGMRSQLIRKK